MELKSCCKLIKHFLIILGCSVLFLGCLFITSCNKKFKKNDELQSSPSLNIEKSEIIWLNNKAFSFQGSEQDSIYYYATKALTLSRDIGYLHGEGHSNLYLGIFYCSKRDYLKSLEFFNAALDLFSKTNDIVELNRVKIYIGDLLHYLKRLKESNIIYQEVLLSTGQTHDTTNLCKVLISVSKNYFDNNDIPSSKRNLYYAYYLATKIKNIEIQGRIFRESGNLFLAIKDFNLALNYYYKALNLELQSDNQINLGSLYTLIGHIYSQLGNFKLSQEYNYKALYIREINNQVDLYASSLINIGRTYFELGNKDSSLYFLQKGIEKSKERRQLSLLTYAHNGLFKLYNKESNFPLALKYFQLYDAYKDSLNIENYRKEVSLYLTNLAISEQERFNSLLKHENSIQRMQLKERTILFFLFLFLFLFTLVLCLLIYYILIKSRKAKKKEEELNISLKHEIAERIQTEQKLIQSEKNYRFIADNVLDVITRFDANFKRSFISNSGVGTWGYTREELLSIQDIFTLVHPDSKKVLSEALLEIKKKKEPITVLYQGKRKDGKYFWAQTSVNPILDPESGELAEMISVMRDVTKQVEQEESLKETALKKELLMRELNHRVKNNFSTLASLTGMHKNIITDKKVLDLFTDLQLRVRTMALVHEQLYSSNTTGVLPIGTFLSNLVNIISNSLNDGRVTVHTSINEELLGQKVVLPLGLVVNELITNVFKHAFPDKRSGNLWIEYKHTDSGSDGQRRRMLAIRDDGVGLPENYSLRKDISVGNTIILLLAEQLEAKLFFENNNGASFTLTIPISEEY